MAQAFFGGVHPNDMKAATNEKAIEQLEAPAEVVIPMSMHIGAPCKPIVAVGDKVTIGQKIGEPGGFVSAPIHASVSGTVKAVEPRPFSMGGTMMSVVIENDFQNTVCPDIHPVEDPDSLTPEQLVEIVKNAGIVGRCDLPHPCEDQLRSRQGGLCDHQRRRVRALHHRRPPHHAGASGAGGQGRYAAGQVLRRGARVHRHRGQQAECGRRAQQDHR